MSNALYNAQRLFIFFILAPIVSPVITGASRSDNGSVLTVGWQPVSLEDAGGFYRNRIALSSIIHNIPLVKYIPYNESNTEFIELDPFTLYTLTITLVVIDTVQGQEITGPSSEAVEILPLSKNG